MKDCFYADYCDLQKWSTLMQLAEPDSHIFYVAMYAKESPPSNVDARVWSHFRNLREISSLDPRIDFFDVPFTHASRTEYFATVRGKLSGERPYKTVVFLDPDTGIAPSRCSGEHITAEEVVGIWDKLQSGDILAIYQHKDHTKDCFEVKKSLLEKKLGTHCSVKTDKNVGFLSCTR